MFHTVPTFAGRGRTFLGLLFPGGVKSLKPFPPSLGWVELGGGVDEVLMVSGNSAFGSNAAVEDVGRCFLSLPSLKLTVRP